MTFPGARATVSVLVGVTIVLHATGWILVVRGRNVSTPGDADTSVAAFGFLVAAVAFTVVGAVIVSQRPRNAVGWLFLVSGFGFALSNATAKYADYAVYADPGALPAGTWAGWVTGLGDPIVFVVIMLLFQLFPDGDALTARWRPVVWFVLAAVLLAIGWNAVRPGPIFTDTMPFDNPAGLPWVAEHLAFVDAVVFMAFAAGLVLSVTSALLRFRRSDGIERDRMKWLAYAAVVLVTSIALAIASSAVGAGSLGDFLIGLGFAGVPIAVGIGVLRYRLYDIDRVISRTLAFALVTGALAVVYVALVLVGQVAFSSIAGGSGLVIAISTLSVAALFLPLRVRIQRVVDRRFNRRRYDAERTLEAFGARLREQVDLQALTVELRGAVDETMQPSHVALWLRRAGV